MNIAFIPIRSGSKSIKDKNIKLFNSKPLVYWVLDELNKSKVDRIVVATDSDHYSNIIIDFNLDKIEIYKRSKENSQDNSSTESVMLEYINTLNSYEGNIILVQATNPFLKSIHIDEALNLKNKYNSIISVAINKRFYWSVNNIPLNYDYFNRPRRQDFDGQLIENGSFYINSIKDIIKFKNRLNNNPICYIMPEYTSYEIDEESDWVMCEQLHRRYNIND